MKIRSSFVSNSSSSSFLIYGTVIDQDRIKLINDEDINDTLAKMFRGEEDISIHQPPDDSIYVGASWDCIGDNETGKAFKNRVEKILKEKLGYDFECSTLAESWYDG